MRDQICYEMKISLIKKDLINDAIYWKKSKNICYIDSCLVKKDGKWYIQVKTNMRNMKKIFTSIIGNVIVTKVTNRSVRIFSLWRSRWHKGWRWMAHCHWHITTNDSLIQSRLRAVRRHTFVSIRSVRISFITLFHPYVCKTLQHTHRKRHYRIMWQRSIRKKIQ